jgi:uncharacterized protein (DUF488 family)
MNPLFTIGHSTHELPQFLQLLKRHNIEEIVDVRSQPYSRHTPWFSREALEHALKIAGVRYLYLGRELGARRQEPDCYIQGKVSYDRIAAAAAFRSGLDRLRHEATTTRVALMCAEKDPLDCHRTILVARHATTFAEISHILADAALEPHAETERRMRAKYGLDESDLFLPPTAQLAEAYTLRGSEIAYVEEESPTLHP